MEKEMASLCSKHPFSDQVSCQDRLNMLKSEVSKSLREKDASVAENQYKKRRILGFV